MRVTDPTGGTEGIVIVIDENGKWQKFVLRWGGITVLFLLDQNIGSDFFKQCSLRAHTVS